MITNQMLWEFAIYSTLIGLAFCLSLTYIPFLLGKLIDKYRNKRRYE